MSERLDSPALETIDVPDPKVVPHPGPSTIRGAETKVGSDTRNGEFNLSVLDKTGAYTPSSPPVDPSAMTGAYIPNEGPKSGPAVQGYEILGELGRGGMGVVYKARQIGLDRLVALKMILSGAHALPKDLERFRAEAQAVARFQHPNIVQIYEVGESEGLPYFSLEFVDGGTLASRIHHEPQTAAYAASTIESLARAMQYAHDRGVVHRDLKPANVLMCADGAPKVTDFGLAKRLEQDSGQTQAGTILGTPSYMAPEQAMGDTDKVGPAADVYALGAMLYDMMTGRPPFTGSSVLDTLEMVRKREPVPPGSLTAKLPRDLETICLKCLHKESERRYASAGDLADDLRRFQDGRPILARPVSLAERSWRWAKRNPTVAGLSSATALLIVAVAIITTVMSFRLNAKKNEAERNFQTAEENFRAAKLAEEKEAEQKRLAEIARDKAKKAQLVTGDQRNLALDVVRGISVDVDNILGTKQSLAPLRIAIQQKMLSDVNKIRDHAAKNPLDDRGEAVALSKLGDIYMQANRVQDAADQYRRVRAIFEQFIKDHADDPMGRRDLAAVTNKFADSQLRLGNTSEARDLYAAALKLRQEWVEMVPGHAPAKQSVAQSYMLLGRVNLELGEPATAFTNFETAEQEYSELPNDLRSSLAVQHERLEIRELIAECHYKLGKAEKADSELKATYKDRQALAKSYPQYPVLQRDLAVTRLRIGDSYMFDRREAIQALVEYAPAYKEVSAQAKADPENLALKREVSHLAYRMGVTVGCLADTLPAGPVLRLTAHAFFAECLAARLDLAKADPKDTRGQIDVLVALGRLGRSADVEKNATVLLSQAGKDRRVLFQAICGLALAGGGEGPAAERCRNRAFDELGSLVAAGWKDRVALETDPDLDQLRNDKRFARLVDQLSQK